ncbi:MAG TPA: Fe-S-containing protein [Thermoanaerobaculia bacterium]|nr:Fe-S-containing protein [Thermoanaerobaculia bacterium]
MLESLILTLREGIEAALVVGIIVAVLRKEGREGLLGVVWAGLATAVAASVAGAWLLYRIAVNQEAFEGVLYLTSAVVVATFVVWMWRHSRAIAGEVRGSLGRILAREGSVAVGGGLFLFTFLMVFREGVETALFLSAVSLTTSGLATFFGAALGLGAAVVFGVLFVRGSLRIDLGRFFRITGIALLIFVVQLLLNGYHELAEAGWLPANETSMAVVGPLVRNDFFFLAAVLLLPVLLLWMPGSSVAGAAAAPGDAPGAGAGNQAAARLERAAQRRQRRSRLAAAVLGVLILVVLGVGFVHSQPAATRPPATPVEIVDGQVRLPLADLAAGRLQHYVADVGGSPVRFFVFRRGDDDVVAAFDACLICGDKGYSQQGSEITCLHCHAAIYPPSIGQEGGCNPIPLAASTDGSELVIAAADLGVGTAAAGHGMHH